MAIRKILAMRFTACRKALSPTKTENSPIIIPPNATKTNFHKEYLTSPDSGDKSYLQRFIHRRSLNHQACMKLPEFLFFPTTREKLREKLRDVNFAGDRLRFDGLTSKEEKKEYENRISVKDAKKLLKFSQLEKLKSKMREIPKNSISYDEFVEICVQRCENEDQGVEFAKLLDESGSVIVLGNIVFLRPEQVARSMEMVISQSIELPNDPRRKELEIMEKEKARIDKKARNLVQGELYCGLGFIMIQTLGFMRLTFWEFSWDVMEPICFFVASCHFAMGYAFFLRTSTEPSFEGYFQRRFKAKQKKLIKIHKFDVGKYNDLRKVFYPHTTSFSHEPLLQSDTVLKL